MLNSKQRAKLRALANTEESVVMIGKNGIDDTLIKTCHDNLLARELIKISVLENAPVSSKEAAIEVSAKTHSDVVQVVGRKFILYRKNTKKSTKLDEKLAQTTIDSNKNKSYKGFSKNKTNSKAKNFSKDNNKNAKSFAKESSNKNAKNERKTTSFSSENSKRFSKNINSKNTKIGRFYK